MQSFDERLLDLRHRLRAAVAARRLDDLSGPGRALAIALVAMSALTMTLFLLVSLGLAGEVAAAGPVTRLAVSAVALSGLGLGLAVFGATRTTTGPTRPSTRRVRRLTDGLLSLAALAIPLTLVVIDAPANTGLPPVKTLVVRALLWLSVAASLLLLTQRRAGHDRVLDVRRFLALLLPTGLVLGVVAATLVISGSADATVALTGPASAAAGFAAVVIVPANLVGQAVDGLADHRSRGVRLSALTDRRPWLTPVLVLAKLALIVALALLVQPAVPGAALIGSSPLIWAGSAVVALIVLTLLTLERRLGLSIDDSATVARLVTRVFAAPLAAVALLSWLIGVLPSMRSHPGVLGCLVFLVALVVLIGRVRSGLDGPTRWLLVLPLAAVLSWFAGLINDGLNEVIALPPAASPTIVALVAVVALAVGLLAGLIAVVGWAIVARQHRLLSYLVAVVVWFAIRTGLDALAPGTTALNIDLALSIGLLVAAVLWMAGRQGVVDGFEIVVTAAVLLALVEVPLALGALPAPAERVLVTLGLLTPGLAALWTHTAQLRGASVRTGWRGLALTGLGYALLVGFVWVVGGNGGDFVDNAGTFIADYLAVPIALLFVTAASADRAQPTSPD